MLLRFDSKVFQIISDHISFLTAYITGFLIFDKNCISFMVAL